MKQCTGSSPMFTTSDVEVAEILAELLPTGFRLPFTWGRKGMRSAIRVTPSSLSPSISPFHHHQHKTEASSPATPLSFSPSESEDKNTLLRKNVSLKRKRDHYVKIVEELTKDNDLLHGEIKNVQCYLDQLKDFNLKLKARKKQELSLTPNQDHEQRQMQFPVAVHSPPLFVNQTAQLPQISYSDGQPTTSFGMPSTSGSALGNSNNNMGPIGIPDLNLPIEESMAVECCEPLDVSLANKNLSKAIAAQARQKRIQIYKIKNPIANSKLRHSCR